MLSKKSCFVSFLLLVFLFCSCTKYERQVVPFQLPSAYPNVTQVSGASLAAKAYDDKKAAESEFGFDILGSGVYPVQVVFDNRGNHPIEIVPNQTFLTDVENQTWPILDAGLAYDRIYSKTQYGNVLPEAGKAGVIGGTAGAIIGAAIGIVAGGSVGEYAMRGAAAGAAGGITLGGAKGLTEKDPAREIRQDLQERSLENRPVKPSEVAYGFIFFPREAKKARELRLQVKETDTGKIHVLTLQL